MRHAPLPYSYDTTRSTGAMRIVFVVTEDWFFVSHFLPMIRAARAAGLEPIVVTRVRAHGAIIEAAGARIVPLNEDRRSLDPLSILASVRALRRILAAEGPAIVHCIALRSILVGGIAARLAAVPARIYALTGLGFLGARRGLPGAFATFLVGLTMRGLLGGRDVVYVFENRTDPLLLALDPDTDNDHVVVLGGAGVDPNSLPEQTLPPFEGELKVAIVSRMLWSKGIDTAVEAVRIARREGVNVTLSLFGAPDPSNPKAIEPDLLSRWNRINGVTWHGATQDVSSVWAGHHVACLPSRGGEGLPRTLLEAASCGRAIVTTDVPGCRDLVRDGREGLVVPPDDPRELARAFATLAADRWLVEAMGKAARIRIADGFTQKDVETRMGAAYRRIAARISASRRSRSPSPSVQT